MATSYEKAVFGAVPHPHSCGRRRHAVPPHPPNGAGPRTPKGRQLSWDYCHHVAKLTAYGSQKNCAWLAKLRRARNKPA
eukprot:1826494-Prymnesium_polylepis.1